MIVAWVALALAGVHTAALVPAAVACAALSCFYRPRLSTDSYTRTADLCALAIVGAGLVQLVPLPRSLAAAISPASARVHAALALTADADVHPISIDPPSTMAAVAIFAALVLLYLTARRIFEHGGVRTVARIVAVTGLLLSALALAQDATGRGRLYWGLVAIGEGPPPFGPFVNRNHFATWAIMAVALTVGYLRAHATTHGGFGAAAALRRRLALAMDGRAILLGAAVVVLIVATFKSLSRSGLIGMTVAILTLVALSAPARTPRGARHLSRKGAWHLLPFAMLVAAAAVGIVMYVDPQALAARFGGAAPAAADRLTIWRETVPIVRDSWLTGTGLGTYLTAMLVYQQSHPGVIFNQAHNHFLQIAAEGGLLAGLPAIVGLIALARAGSRALRQDVSGTYWIRAGCAAGLAGVAAQSIWETGLVIPANGALAAVLAAILLHTPKKKLPGTFPER